MNNQWSCLAFTCTGLIRTYKLSSDKGLSSHVSYKDQATRRDRSMTKIGAWLVYSIASNSNVSYTDSAKHNGHCTCRFCAVTSDKTVISAELSRATQKNR